jgi:poly-gamma-glutamate synthesis protein (capsule biosynthesis protein)
VNLLADLSAAEVRKIADQLQAIRRAGNIVVASIHWGGNWGYEVSAEENRFAHQLIDEAGVDIVHGHSSHHAKGIEVYNGKPILYGCGDFINDYESIPGYQGYRDDLSLMYLVRMAPATGKLVELKMIPMQIRQFRLHHASERDAAWLKDTLHRESRRFDTGVEIAANGSLHLHW